MAGVNVLTVSEINPNLELLSYTLDQKKIIVQKHYVMFLNNIRKYRPLRDELPQLRFHNFSGEVFKGFHVHITFHTCNVFFLFELNLC